MKKLSVGILLMLVSVTIKSFGQIASNTEAADSTNIYWQSLKIYVDNLGNQGQKNLLIEKDDLTTQRLPAKIGNYNIIYVDNNAVQSHLKGKEQIQVIKIIPLRIKKGDFFVSIIPFTVKKEKNSTNYINSGGDKIIFNFDSTTKTFVFKEIFHGGI